MTLKLYDLALADPDIRPSPFCWLVKFSLLHKGLEFETVPVGFADKTQYPNADHGKVPILVVEHGGEPICESRNILAWLEKNHPEKPLVASVGERAASEFFEAWAFANLYPALAPILMIRIHASAREDDKAYFRKTREERFGKTLEELAATPGLAEKIETALKTLAAPLTRHKFLGGEQPNLGDYMTMSPFMWQRCVTREELYEAPQAVDAWRERMLDLFNGYARRAKSAGGKVAGDQPAGDAPAE